MSFKDIKIYNFGMGMVAIHTKSTERRDRLFLISAIVIALLTLLGKAMIQLAWKERLKRIPARHELIHFGIKDVFIIVYYPQ